MRKLRIIGTLLGLMFFVSNVDAQCPFIYTSVTADAPDVGCRNTLPSGTTGAPDNPISVCPSHALQASIDTFYMQVVATDLGDITLNNFTWVVYGGTITQYNRTNVTSSVGYVSGIERSYYVGHDTVAGGETMITVQWDTENNTNGWIALLHQSEWGCTDTTWFVYYVDIEDNTDPSITFLETWHDSLAMVVFNVNTDTTLNVNDFRNFAGTPYVVTANVLPDTSDNCLIASMTPSPNINVDYLFDSNPAIAENQHTVTWTALDGVGNDSVASQHLFIYPADSFLIYSPADTSFSCSTAELDAEFPPGTYSATAHSSWILDSLVTSLGAPVAVAAGCNYERIRTYTAYWTHINGHTKFQKTSTRTYSYYKIATPDIQVIARNITVYLDQTGTYRLYASDLNNGSTDAACSSPLTFQLRHATLDGVSVRRDYYDLLCTDIGGLPNFMLYAYDACGNEGGQPVSVVTVLDTIAPIWDKGLDDTDVYQCTSGGRDAAFTAWVIANGGSTVTEGCTLLPIVVDSSAAWVLKPCPNDTLYTRIVAFTATDNSTNSSTVTDTFIVLDNIDPVLTFDEFAFPDEIECSEATRTADSTLWVNNLGGAIITEACADLDTFITVEAWRPWPEGGPLCSSDTTEFLRATWRIAAGCDTLTIVDTLFYVNFTAPTLSDNPAISDFYECIAGGYESAYDTWLNTYNCGVTVTGGCNVTFSFDTIYADLGAGLVWHVYSPCSNDTLRYIVVEFTATESCGAGIPLTSIAFRDTFAVIDTQKPLITYLADNGATSDSYECDPFQNVIDSTNWINNHGWATVTDACSSVTWDTPTFLESGWFDMSCQNDTIKRLAVQFRVYDECGHDSIFSDTLYIVNQLQPTLVDTSNVDDFFECNSVFADEESAYDNWLLNHGFNHASGACDGQWNKTDTISAGWIQNTDFSGDTIRYIVVQFEYEDNECGGSFPPVTLIDTFAVMDTEPPVLTQIGGFSDELECDITSIASDTITWLSRLGGLDVTDACDMIRDTVITQVTGPGWIDWTATPCESDTLRYAVYHFTVRDSAYNTVVSANDTLFIVNFIAPGFDDVDTDFVNCNSSNSYSADSAAWIANHGYVNIRFACGDDWDDSGIVVGNWVDAGCPNDTVMYFIAQFPYRDECSTVPVMFIDTFVVIDNTPPVVTWDGNAIENRNTNSNSDCTYTVNGDEFNPTVVENCDTSMVELIRINATVALNDTVIFDVAAGQIPTLNDSALYIGNTFIQWIFFDCNGQSDTTSFNVLVTDTIAPEVTCAANVPHVIFCDTIYDLPIPAVYDNCATDSLIYILNGDKVTTNQLGQPQVDNVDLNVGDNTVSWILFDVAGNSDTCTYTVHVDRQPEVRGVSVVRPLCVGNSNASISIDSLFFESATTILYSIDGTTTQLSRQFTGLASGNHSVYVNVDGCFSQAFPVTITEPDDTILAVSITNVQCAGDSTGIIDITATSGGRALNFDGNDYLLLSDSLHATMPELSGAAWIKPTGNGTILSFNANEYFSLSVNGGELRLTSTDNSGSSSSIQTTGANLTDGLWHYVSFRMNGTGRYIYVDTLMVESEPFGTIGDGLTTSMGAIGAENASSVFADNTNLSNYYNGSIAYVYLWNSDVAYLDLVDVMLGVDPSTVGTLVGNWDVGQNDGTYIPNQAVSGSYAINNSATNTTFDHFYYSWNNEANSWSPDSTVQDIHNLPYGDYTLTYTNHYGCSFVRTFTVGINDTSSPTFDNNANMADVRTIGTNDDGIDDDCIFTFDATYDPTGTDGPCNDVVIWFTTADADFLLRNAAIIDSTSLNGYHFEAGDTVDITWFIADSAYFYGTSTNIIDSTLRYIFVDDEFPRFTSNQSDIQHIGFCQRGAYSFPIPGDGDLFDNCVRDSLYFYLNGVVDRTNRITQLGGSISIDMSVGDDTLVWVLKDAYENTTVDSIFLHVDVQPIITGVSVRRPTCQGGNNGYISIDSLIMESQTNMGYSMDSISWQPENYFTGLTAGTYNLWIRDEFGCSSIRYTVLMTDPDPVTMSNIVIDHEDCAGDVPDGGISINTLSNGVDALTFNAASSHQVLLPTYFNAQLPTLTGAAWIRTGSVTGTILSFDQGQYFTFDLDGGRVSVTAQRESFGTITRSSTELVNDNLWHFVSFVFDGTNLVVNVDTTNIGVNSIGFAGNIGIGSGTRYGVIGNSSTTATFGSNTPGVGLPFNGAIAEVMLWSSALSNDQLRAVMNGTIAPAPDLGYWKLGQTDGDYIPTLNNYGSYAINQGATNSEFSHYYFAWTKDTDATFTRNTQNISNIFFGDYNVLITDHEGCTLYNDTLHVDTDDKTAPVFTNNANSADTIRIDISTDGGADNDCDFVFDNSYDPAFTDACVAFRWFNTADFTRNAPDTISLSGYTFVAGDTINVTWSVADSAYHYNLSPGNRTDSTITYIFLDDIDPVVACKDTTIYLDNTGNFTIDATFIDNGSNDNCHIASLSLDITAFNCTHIGSNPNAVVLTVTDDYGNFLTCNATVTVLDTLAPVMTYSTDTIYGCATNLADSSTVVTGLAIDDASGDGISDVFSDNCASDAYLGGTIAWRMIHTPIAGGTDHSTAWASGNPNDFTLYEGSNDIYYRVTDEYSNVADSILIYHYVVQHKPVLSAITSSSPVGFYGGADEPLRYSQHTYYITYEYESDLTSDTTGWYICADGWDTDGILDASEVYTAVTDYTVVTRDNNSATNVDSVTIRFEGLPLETALNLVFIEGNSSACITYEIFDFILHDPFDIDIVTANSAPFCPDTSNNVLTSLSSTQTVITDTIVFRNIDYEFGWNFTYTISVIGTNGASAVNSVSLSNVDGSGVISDTNTGSDLTGDVSVTYVNGDATFRILYRLELEDIYGSQQTVTISLTNITGSFNERDIDGTDADDNQIVHTILALPRVGDISGQ